MKSMNRREFVRQSCLAASAFALPTLIPSTALGDESKPAPSNRIVMGGIGLGDQGTRDMQNFLNQDDVQFVAACDADANRLGYVKKIINDKYGNTDCAAFGDMRKLLERKDIDAVLIATGDRWHTPASILAAKAGKDIYCEKPLSLTIAEGRKLANTIKRYGRIYQSGTQRRSMRTFAFAVQLARQGKLGKLHTLHCNLSRGGTLGDLPEQAVPKELNYDMWLGPAPFTPYHKDKMHYGWKFHYDYAGGMMTDWGAHCIDLAQWAHKSDRSGPVEFEGKAEFPQSGFCNTAVRYSLTATYTDGVKIVCHDSPLMPEKVPGNPLAVKFEGTEGSVYVDDNGNVITTPESLAKEQKFSSRMEWWELGNWQGHHRNFLDCVKTRQEPIAPAEVAHRSVSVCHVANICLRLGRKLKWNPDKEKFVDDAEANRMIARPARAGWDLI